jgi:hypothetical protein
VLAVLCAGTRRAAALRAATLSLLAWLLVSVGGRGTAMRLVSLLLLLAPQQPKGATAFCTCPDTASVCTSSTLFSSTGEEDCSGTVIDATISVEGAQLLTTVELGTLESVSGSIRMGGNANLVSIAMPLLASAETIDVGGVNVAGNPLLRSLTLPSLQNLSGDLNLQGNQGLEELDVSSLSAIGGFFYIGSTGIGSFNVLTTLSFPVLTTVGGHFFVQYLEELTTLEIPLLESTGSYFIVSAADALTDFVAPRLASAGGAIAGRAVSFDGPWGALQSISLPALTEAAGNVYVRVNEGTTPMALDLSEFGGDGLCVRAQGLALGSGSSCFFPGWDGWAGPRIAS